MSVMAQDSEIRIYGRRQFATIELRDWRYYVRAGAYRAEFPACGHDDPRTACAIPLTVNHDHQHSVINAKGKRSTSVNDWLTHCKDHCHGWHDEKIRAFVDDVLKTFR